jgi:hypothetical protein
LVPAPSAPTDGKNTRVFHRGRGQWREGTPKQLRIGPRNHHSDACRVEAQPPADPVFIWSPAGGGIYALQVWARDAGSTSSYEAWTGTGYFEIRP